MEEGQSLQQKQRGTVEIVGEWLFRILEVTSAVLIITSSVLDYLRIQHDIRLDLVNFFMVVFGLWISLANLVIPRFIIKYIPFYMNGMGRGLFFTFVGAIALGHRKIHLAAGIITLSTAFFHYLGWITSFFFLTSLRVPRPLCAGGEHRGGNRLEALVASNSPLGFFLHLLNFAVGLTVLFYGVLFLFLKARTGSVSNFRLVIIAAFYVLFGLIIIIFEFFIPLELQQQIPFYMHFCGRSVFFLFLGGLIIGPTKLSLACGILALISTVVYFFLFIGSRCNCCCPNKLGLPAPCCTSTTILRDREEYGRLHYVDQWEDQYQDIDEPQTDREPLFDATRTRGSAEYDNNVFTDARQDAGNSSMHEEDFVSVSEAGNSERTLSNSREIDIQDAVLDAEPGA